MHSIKETYITRISILYLNIQWINVGWHNYAPGLEALEHGRKRLGERLWWQEFRGPSLDHGDTNPGELLPKKRDFFTFENGEAQKKRSNNEIYHKCIYHTGVYVYIPIKPIKQKQDLFHLSQYIPFITKFEWENHRDKWCIFHVDTGGKPPKMGRRLFRDFLGVVCIFWWISVILWQFKRILEMDL